MADAFQSFGCATSTTIAVMIPTNPLTCVVKETARLAGRDAPDNRTIVAFPNGCSAMAKTIVATTATSCQKTVPSVNRRLTSSARTTDAFLNSGRVTLLTIAVMDRTKQKRCAKESTASAQSQSSDATTENVFRADGDVVS